MKPRIVSVLTDGTTRTHVGTWLGPQSHKVYPPDFCYLCEKTGADSEDHVIAESFFGGTSDELPLLLAHRKCNADYSDAEEYVRNVLVQLDAAKGAACEAARAKVLGALKPPVPIPRARRKWEQQLRETRRVSDGYIWVASEVSHENWQRAFWKISRGLCFWYTGRLCPGPAECQWGTSTMYEWPALEDKTFWFTIGDGFSMSALVDGTERTLTQGDLRLRFYQGVPIRVAFGMAMGKPPGE